MNRYKTPQEELWAGDFGDAYAERNESMSMVAGNTHLFSNILRATAPSPQSVMEIGANIGMNMVALHTLLPHAEISGIEINKFAYERLCGLGYVKAYHTSAFDFTVDYARDFVFTKGVLIHINPDLLPDMYRLLYELSNRYICICEYYNLTPTVIEYRGNSNALFKRDFAGEMMDTYSDLELIDYGFIYHRANTFPADDLTWFLMKKT